MKESKIVTFIGGFYVFGGIVALLSLIFRGDSLNAVFGLPNDIPDYVVKLVVATLYTTTGYLYLQRVKLGYWLILVSSIVVFCISATLTTRYQTQPYIGNMLYALFVAVVSIVKREEFVNDLRQVLSKKGKGNEV